MESEKAFKSALILTLGFMILQSGTPQGYAQFSSSECSTTSECSSRCSEAARMLTGAVGAGVAGDCESRCISDAAGLASGRMGDASAWMSQCIAGAGSGAAVEQNYYTEETYVGDARGVNNRGIDRRGLAVAGTQGTAAGEGRFSAGGGQRSAARASGGGARRRG